MNPCSKLSFLRSFSKNRIRLLYNFRYNDTKKSVLLQGFWWPAMSHVLNSSMLLMTSSITSEIIYYYTASWLCWILKYSNSWKISVGLLRKIFLLLLIYWLISSISWRCRSRILRRRLLMLCSVRIRVSVATASW